MKTVAANQTKVIDRNAQWLRVAAVGLGALLLLAAAVDQRNAISYRMSGDALQVERLVPAASQDELIRDMLTHD